MCSLSDMIKLALLHEGGLLPGELLLASTLFADLFILALTSMDMYFTCR